MPENQTQDSKMRIVLAQFGNEALVFTGLNSPEPYVVAHNFDPETMTWGHGTYYSDLGRAWDEINPDIIEQATVRWSREDIREWLYDDEEIDDIEAATDAILNDADYFQHWADQAIADVNEAISDSICEYKYHNPQKDISPLPGLSEEMEYVAIQKDASGKPSRYDLMYYNPDANQGAGAFVVIKGDVLQDLASIPEGESLHQLENRREWYANAGSSEFAHIYQMTQEKPSSFDYVGKDGTAFLKGEAERFGYSSKTTTQQLSLAERMTALKESANTQEVPDNHTDHNFTR